ncbi:mucin-5AC [Drosophila tropicalis]|uniref:mucin-5AC n=1 Tax=Drosophila tropicalis TaxID=46794 RepID=UPI0035ABBC09
MSWFNKKKETDQSSETAPNWSLVQQDPRKNVRTTSAATSTTNTAVQNSTIFDHNNHTVTYLSTRQTVTHTQQAKVTEIVHRRTPSQAELEELFASMRMGKGATTTTTTTTTATGNSRSRPPSLNGVALRSTTNFKPNATNSTGGAKRTSTIAKTEHTTVTQKNGKTVTQRVETQRVEVKPKSRWAPWSTQSSASPSSSSATAPSSSTALKPYVSPYAQEKPSAFGYASTYGQQKPLTTSFTPSTSFKPTTSSKILTSTSVPKPYSSYTAPTIVTPISHFDAKGSMPEKPSTSSSTSSLSKIFAKKKLKPARVYIFNHEKFDTENEFRVGSAQDVKSLRKVFEQLKCKVEVITNGTVATVRSTIKMLESKRFEEQSALVIVILTHGRRHDKLAARDSDYSLDDDVIFPILRNRTLLDKPKLIFVQACKGSMEKGGFKTDAAQPHGAPNEIYKCYSTYEGYVSFRTEDGTPFIQTLCEALERSGKTKDIDSIMTDVRVVVKQATQDGQIPSVTSTLTSKYVFGDYL